MPTYSQLALEPAWNAEYAPDNLDAFYRALRVFYNLPASHIGGKGDNRHLRGYHRSRKWILTSQYCTSRTYSVTNALDKGGDENWLAALDATIPAQALYDACRRLDAAVRAGRLPQVAQWFGSFDGQSVVGWSYGRAASSDDSHLWHLHISFYRSLANADHTLLYEILTGTEGGDVTVLARKGDKNTKYVHDRLQVKLEKLKPGCLDPYGADGGFGSTTAKALAAELDVGDGSVYTTGDEANLDRKIDKLEGGSGGGGDTLSEAERAEVREIAEDVAEAEIASTTVTLKPAVE